MARLSQEAVEQLQPLLAELQAVPGLTQIKPAIFYCRHTPMLHFHETPQGIFADVKCVVPVLSGFDRMNTAAAADRRRLVAQVAARCALLLGNGAGKRS